MVRNGLFASWLLVGAVSMIAGCGPNKGTIEVAPVEREETKAQADSYDQQYTDPAKGE